MADRSLRLEMILSGIDRATAPFRKVQKASADLGKDLKAARDRLKQLDASQKDLEGFGKLETDVVSTTLELKKAKAAAADLQRQFQSAEAPTKRLTDQFTRAREAVARLETKQGEEVRRLSELRGKLEATGVSTGDLAGQQDRLRRETADANRAIDLQKDKLADLSERQKRMDRASGIMSNAGGQAGQVAAVGAAAGAGAYVVGRAIQDNKEIGNQFESRMTTIGQKADLSRQATRKLGDQLRATALIVNQMPEELQAATDTLTGFGLAVPVAVELTNPIGKAATAYEAQAADLSATVFSVMDNLKVEKTAKAAGLALDTMALAGKKGGFEIQDMAASFPSLTAGYAALGQTDISAVADLSAALQITRKGAADGAEAAGNLENVLQKIASPQTVKSFAKMGVDLPAALKKAAAAGKTPIEAIAEITRDTLKGDLGKIGYLFEDAQVQKGLRPLIQNLQEYRDIRAAAGKAGGTIDADFAERQKDAAQPEKAKNIAVNDLQIQAGQQLAPLLTPMNEKITEVVKNFTAWTKENPKLAAVMAKVAVGVGIFLAGIAAIAFIVVPILAVIGLIGAAATALSVPFIAVAGAIAIAVGVIIGLVVGVILAIKQWQTLGPIVAKVFADLVDRVRGAVGFVFNLHSKFVEAGLHVIQGLAAGIGNGLGVVRKAITDAGGQIVEWFKTKLGIHSPSRVFAGLGGFMMQGLEKGLQRGADGPLRRIRDMAGDLTAAMSVTAPDSPQIASLQRVRDKAFAVQDSPQIAPPRVQRIRDMAGGLSAALAVTMAPQASLAAPAAGPGLPPARPAAAARPPIEIHVHIHAAPGMSETALVDQAVARMSQELQRQAPPDRRNASFRDGWG